MRFMKRYAWIAGALLIVVLLMAVEMTIIANTSGYEAKEKVVYAKVHMDKNTVITGDMLEIREIVTGMVHPGALETIDAAISKRTGMDIEAGEMLLKTKLLSGEHCLIEAEDKSKRLFSVEFGADQANGWQLADGRYVDIIYVPNNSEQQNQQFAAGSDRAALPVPGNVQVIRNIRIAGLIDEEGKLVDISKSKGTPRYISFEVTEEQAVFLAYAKRSGKLELSCIPG